MYEVVVPKIEANTDDVVFVEWLKEENDFVKKGEPLFVIETIKAVMEIEAEESGYLIKKVVKEGDEIKVLDTVAYLGKKGEVVNKDKVKEKKELKISPVAKKIAKEHNLNLEEIFTDHKGVIREKDVLGILEKEKSTLRYKTEKLSHIKKTEIKNLQNNCNIPSSHVIINVSVDKIKENVEKFFKKHNIRITTGEYISYKTGMELKKFNRLNSSLKDDSLLLYDDVNLGVAMEIDDVLYVPVIHKLEKIDIKGFSEWVKRTALDIMTGRIQPSDFTNGTFTVTDLSTYDVYSFKPLINSNQAAILGICSEYDKVVLKDGKPINEKMQNLILAFDHRIITGKYASEFLNSLKKELEG